MKIKLLLVLCILTIAITGVALAKTIDLGSQSFEVCKYKTEAPCDSTFDCGYHWDGTCCIARCTRPSCWTYCR